MVIHKKTSKIFFVFSTSIISSHVITELLIILAKYLLFFQLHVEGFQV